jgi:Mg/Co/Ni transporter MgtE
MTAAEALDAVRRTNPANNFPEDICVLEANKDETRHIGVLSIPDAVIATPDRKVQDLMTREVKLIDARERNRTPHDLPKHKFMALPVTILRAFWLASSLQMI